MAAATAPVLNLDIIDPPASVEINRIKYALLAPDALSILQFRQLQRLLLSLEHLDSIVDMTDDEGQQMEAVLDGLCRLVLKAPADVLDQLTSMQRLSVYLCFAERPSNVLLMVGTKLKDAAATAPPATPTGASSSPASPASTPASARSTGSKGRRSRSSAPISS